MSVVPDGSAQPLGAEVKGSAVFYRVWAPTPARLSVRVDTPEPREIELTRDARGYWTGVDPTGRPGDRYWYRFPDGRLRPDPASRFQPDGVHGSSEVIDSRSHVWTAEQWRRPGWTGQVTYELHVGAFTKQGTFRAAIARLDHLRELGVEAVELMPLGDFDGGRNWGYDGVALFAPARCYGQPDDLRALVDAAHDRGLAVILDVVYNHLGPAGNYLSEFSAAYFHAGRETPWGQSLNFDGPDSEAARHFFLSNAAYWLDEFRIDGLRLDATHAIVDASPVHLLQELAAVVHARGGFVIAEDNRNESGILRRPDGTGYGIDAMWSDDFHHQVRVALTSIRESYFASYDGTTDAVVDVLEHGWTYRGQPYPFWKNAARGTTADHLDPSAFVVCLENHDQVGNRALGERLAHLVSDAAYRAASLFLCLNPLPPLLFMGQEWGASTPFLFFTDHAGELGRQVSAGRQKEFAESRVNVRDGDVPDPQALSAFERSKLRWNEIEGARASCLELYQKALAARRQLLGPAQRARDRWRVSGTGNEVVVRYQSGGGEYALVWALFAQPAGDSAQDILPLPAGGKWRVELDSAGTTAGTEWRPAPGPRCWWLRSEGPASA